MAHAILRLQLAQLITILHPLTPLSSPTPLVMTRRRSGLNWPKIMETLNDGSTDVHLYAPRIAPPHHHHHRRSVGHVTLPKRSSRNKCGKCIGTGACSTNLQSYHKFYSLLLSSGIQAFHAASYCILRAGLPASRVTAKPCWSGSNSIILAQARPRAPRARAF